MEIFATVARHQLHRDGTLVQTFQPELTAQQQQVVELLGGGQVRAGGQDRDLGAVDGLPVNLAQGDAAPGPVRQGSSTVVSASR